MKNKKWKIWFEVFSDHGEKIGTGVYYHEYKYKGNAERAAKKMYGKEPKKFKYIISVDNPFVTSKIEPLYALAICDIEFKNTEFAVVVNACNKVRAESEMKAAYECWSSECAEECIIPGYDTDSITQACYGDFIIEWLNVKCIPCDEAVGVVWLDTYCHEEPPADYAGDPSYWLDNHITTYWFKKSELDIYLKTLGTTTEDYLHSYTYDDVECDVLQNVPFLFQKTH